MSEIREDAAWLIMNGYYTLLETEEMTDEELNHRRFEFDDNFDDEWWASDD